jgi:hypothetical protein
MITSLNVRGLKINKHETFEYIIVIIFFVEKVQKKLTRELIRREVHLMNDLKANMLIDNDILESEEIFIDEVNSKATIASCNNMIISIEIRTLVKRMINKTLHARKFIVISSHSIIIISIHRSNLSLTRDFLFESFNLNVFMYAHIIDTIIDVVMTKNDFSQSIKISRNTRLEMITKIHYLNVFHVDIDDQNIIDYVERKSVREHKTS